MKSILLCLLLVFGLADVISGQYLPPRFQDATVAMVAVHSSRYVTGNANLSNGIQLYQEDQQPDYATQEWELESVSGSVNYYRIHHIASDQYVTWSGADQPAVLQPYQSGNTGLANQTFQFVAETQTDRFKIHSRYSSGGYDYILTVDQAQTYNGAWLYFHKNITVGNSQHQKFDLTDLYPPANPGSAVPSLADRFQGRTVGMKSKYYGSEVMGNYVFEEVTMEPDFTDFDKQFKIEYTDETGWYKIKHKPTGKYVTITSATDGATVYLKDDAAYADDYQKFKFVVQSANDYTYKIHSKYSVGPSGFERALVLEFNRYNASTPLRLAINITVGNDQWQQFELYKYTAPAAEFTSGAATNGAGKLYGKQYYFSNFESLALLEPYVSGSDTFLRVQTSPVYGAQSEWTIDQGRKQGGVQYFRIRYGKTGQYLYLPTSSENAIPANGFMFKLKKPAATASQTDRRYEFDFRQLGNAQHSFYIVSHAADSSRRAIIDDDGNLSVYLHDDNVSTYSQNEQFIINLTYPTDSTKLYAFMTINQGHFLSDSGISKSSTPIIHREFSDYSCMWRFISLGGNIYYIRSALTGQYLHANNSNAYMAQMYSKTSNSGNYAKWKLSRDGNYYTLQNVGSNMYLALMNHDQPEAYVYQGTVGSAGYYWAISNMDYYTGGLALPVSSIGLLQNYNPLATNAYNDQSYFNKVVQSVGIVYNPSYWKYAAPAGSLISYDFSVNGFNYSNPPNFYEVFRSAFKFTYRWNDLQADSAMKNFRVTRIGNRVDVAYAIRSYILDSLSKTPRNSWTYDERELIAYLERTVQSMKKNWGKRIEDSWNNYLSTKISEELPFTILYTGLVVPTDDYVYPPYIIPTEAQALSQMEYAGYCTYKQYKNPNKLLTTSIPGFGVPAALAFMSGIGYSQVAVHLAAQTAAARAAQAAAEAAGESEEALESLLFNTIDAVEAEALFGAVGASGATCIVTVVALAAEMLATAVMTDVKFDQFKTRLLYRANYLDTMTTDVNRVMQGNNLLDQYALCQDFDFILGSGARFNDTLHNDPIFVGNGNWSDGSNWSTNQPPLSIITSPIEEVIINPLEGGECILDVPVILQQGSKITVNPGKTFKVHSQLTVPSMNVYGQ